MRLLLVRQECGACGGSAPVWSDACTRCGLVLHSTRSLRAAGVLYLVLGLPLSVAMSYVMVLLAGIIRHSDDPQSTIRFSGGTWGAVLAFGGLSLGLLIGVIATLMGVWQIRHGRRNPKLVRVLIVIYIIFWTGGMLLRLFTLAV